MNRSRYHRIIILLIFIPLNLYTVAQDKTMSRSAEIAAYYDLVYGADQRLISGAYYYGPLRGTIFGNPYYFDSEWKKGSVFINGVLFENLDLKYDIEKNMLAINFSTIHNSEYQIALNNEKIEYFYIGDRLFKPYPGSNQYDKMKFCEVMTEGRISYYVLKTKFLNVSSEAQNNAYQYKIETKQFLIKDSLVFNFKNRRDLFKLVPENKTAIKKFKREKGHFFLQKYISDRSEIVSYSNSLVKDKN